MPLTIPSAKEVFISPPAGIFSGTYFHSSVSWLPWYLQYHEYVLSSRLNSGIMTTPVPLLPTIPMKLRTGVWTVLSVLGLGT